MSTLVTIQSTDLITNSRADINGNFSALNTDKMETSVLDTDTTLAANSDAKVATQKAVKTYVDANLTTPLSSEVTASTSHTLTTTASQKVVVFAKGNLKNLPDGSTATVSLKYGGTTKDTVNIMIDTDGISNTAIPFSLMYTETPGAATANITVEASTATLENTVILVQKIRI